MPTLKGTEALLSYIQCFLYLISSSITLSFSEYMAGYLLERPYVYMERERKGEGEREFKFYFLANFSYTIQCYQI